MRTLIVTGFLAKDSEVETLPSGSKIFKAVMASNEYGDEKNEDGTNKPLWVNISSFKEDPIRKSQYLKKGSSVIVIGDYRHRLYQTKNGDWAVGIEVSNADIKFNNNGGKKDDTQHNKFPDETSESQERKQKKEDTNDEIPIITSQIPADSTGSDDDDLPF